MYKIEDIRKEFDRLDAITSVNSSKIPIEISHRAKSQRGCCVYGRRTVRKVRFSHFILNDPEEYFYDTVRHEYAHLLVKLRHPAERHGHDRVWKMACQEVGCTPSRLCDLPSELTRSHEQINPYKYRLTCNTCHAEWNYFRMTQCIRSVLSGGSGYSCSICGGASFSVEQLR